MPLHVGLHILRRHQTHIMPISLKFPRPMVGAATGFHPHQARRQLRHVLQELVSFQSLLENAFAARIHAMQLKHALAQINTQYPYLSVFDMIAHGPLRLRLDGKTHHHLGPLRGRLGSGADHSITPA
ncbi:hypothetical protein MAIT1_05127 [Magnetofaba australis IT-1]|uniref:Uncharacterized protein n=1 Tax=Magnetofaba australis IT-1 TaxID=1434232 RepID=A0A1Y2K7G8_9PROT|nr:hypothetical protein MAIT1_05127 [Magnetofaba australis IT-1]